MTEHSVGTRAAGRLHTLLVDEGSTVAAGQWLGTMDRIDQARRDYERARSLYEHGGASLQTVEQAGLAVEDQQILSPVAGVVLLKIHEPGEIVLAGGAVVVIGEYGKLWVRIYVPEGFINRVAVGAPATLRFDGLPHAIQGHVSFVAPKAEFTPRNVQTPEERITQTFAVKVALDEVILGLHPGVAADVTLPLNSAPPR